MGKNGDSSRGERTWDDSRGIRTRPGTEEAPSTERSARRRRGATRAPASIDSSDDAIVSKTLDGVVTSWNLAAQTIYGYGRRDHRQLLAIFGPQDRPDEMVNILRRSGRAPRQHYRPSGSRRTGAHSGLLTVSPIHDADGRSPARHRSYDITGAQARGEQPAPPPSMRA